MHTYIKIVYFYIGMCIALCNSLFARNSLGVSAWDKSFYCWTTTHFHRSGPGKSDDRDAMIAVVLASLKDLVACE